MDGAGAVRAVFLCDMEVVDMTLLPALLHFLLLPTAAAVGYHVHILRRLELELEDQMREVWDLLERKGW